MENNGANSPSVYSDGLYQTQLRFTCGAGALSANIATGNIRFEHSDIKIGTNSYEIGISRVYSSNRSENSEKQVGLGWVLNVGQSIRQEGEKYVYTDGMGNEHDMLLLEQGVGYTKYYDTSGLGLTLKITNGQPRKEIYSNNNYLYFDADGYLVESKKQVAKYYYIVKKYEYENGAAGEKALSVIYDSEKPQSKLVFDYYPESGLLKEIVHKEGPQEKRKVTYIYENNYLTSIIESLEGKSRISAIFKYDTDGKLNYAIDGEDLSALKLYYTGNKIDTVYNGIAEINDYSSVLMQKQCVSCGDAICGDAAMGASYQIDFDEAYYDNCQFVVAGFLTSARCTFSYSKIKTVVTKYAYDETTDGIVYEYNLNSDGETYSVLEKQNNYYVAIQPTVSSTGGIRLSVKASKSNIANSFNGYRSFNISSDSEAFYDEATQRYKMLYFEQNSGALRNDIVDDANENRSARRAVLSAWVKTGVGNWEGDLTLKWTVDDVPYYYRIPLKADKEAWRLVSTVIDLPKQEKSTSFKSYRVGLLSESYSLTRNIKIADVRIVDSMVMTYDKNNQRYLLPFDGVTLTLPDNTTADLDFNSVEFTEQDVSTCLKNKYYSTSTDFEFVYKNNRERVMVKNAVFHKNDVNVELGKSDKLVSEQTIPENIVMSCCVEYGTDTIKEVKMYKKGNTAQSETKTYDLIGREMSETNAYGIKTEYRYDTRGNLVETIVTGNGSKKAIRKTYGYDQYNECRAYKTDENNSKTLYNHEDGFLADMKYPNNLHEFYEYDKLRQKCINISATVDDQEYKNTVEYNKIGKVGKFSGNGMSYDVFYDSFGRMRSFERDGVKFMENRYSYDSEQKAECYESTVNGYSETSYSDKYDRVLKSTVNNEDKVINTYRDDDTNQQTYVSSVAQLRETADLYSGRTTDYKYNKFDELCGYKVNKSNDLLLEITEMALKSDIQQAQYYKYGEGITAVGLKEFDSAIFLNPNVVKTMSGDCVGDYYQSIISSVDGWTTNYDYDMLGRVICKTLTRRRTDMRNESIKENYQYIDIDDFNTTYLLGKVERYVQAVTDSDYTKIYEASYLYDDMGNVTQKTEKIVNQVGTPSHVYSYTYDKLNRLTSEDVVGYEFEARRSHYSTSFEYDASNNRKAVKYKIYSLDDNGADESYSESEIANYNYDPEIKDRLIAYSNNGSLKYFAYDTYGCPKKYKTAYASSADNMFWTRGNLLSKYKNTEYEYDYTGLRTKKIKKQNNTVTETVEYVYDGGRLLAEKYGNATVYYHYDLTGLCGIKVESVNGGGYYTVVKDSDGSVRELWRDNYLAASFAYDYKGTPTETEFFKINSYGHAIDNPDNKYLQTFRWKSYIFDNDNELYYIDDRYYDPELGRYIEFSAQAVYESMTSLGAINGYLFNRNNEVSAVRSLYTIECSKQFNPHTDRREVTWWAKIYIWYSELYPEEKLLMGLVFIAVLATLAVMLPGAAGCLFSTMAMGAMSGASIGFIQGAIISGIFSAISGHFSWDDVREGAAEGFLWGAIDGAIAGAISWANNPQCFIAGTIVLCLDEDGNQIKKPIEEIKVGDKVLAYDEESGKQDYKTVVRLFRNTTKEWYRIKVNGEEIVCTGNHPFFVENIGFVYAKDLKYTYKLLTSSGIHGIIQSIKIEKLSEEEQTYNFEVEDFHTYYVGDDEILVHNECWATQRKKYWQKEAIEQKGNGITYNIDYPGNRDLLAQGKAPIGLDGKRVELHHIKGRNFDEIVQMQFTYHRAKGEGFHSVFGFKDFPDITKIPDWGSKFV